MTGDTTTDDGQHRLENAEPKQQDETDELPETGEEEPEPEPDEIVERFDTGASIEVAITRGTGTRDQDKWRIKGKGRDAEEALEEFETELEGVEAELANRVRALDPEGKDD